jgi:hypothetical protein
MSAIMQLQKEGKKVRSVSVRRHPQMAESTLREAKR